MANPPKTALVYGYIGYENTGDELLLRALCRGVDRHALPFSVAALSRHPEQTQRIHRIDSPLHAPFGGGTRLTLQSRWKRMRAIAKADLLFLGPGGFLQDYDIRGVRSMFGTFRVALMARLFGGRVVAIGLGAGPLVKPWGRRFARWIVGLCDLVVLRDEVSLALLETLGVPADKLRVAADLAFAEVVPSGPRSGNGQRLGVSVFDFYGYIHNDKAKREGLRRALARALDDATAAGYGVDFIAMQGAHGGNDEREACRIVEKMTNTSRVIVHPYAPDPSATLGLIARCDRFLGMRYHAVVMACLAGIPFAAIAYHPKVATLMADLGLASLVVPLEDANECGLNRLLRKLLDTKALSPELLARREALHTKAEQNFRWLAEYCERQFG